VTLRSRVALLVCTAAALACAPSPVSAAPVERPPLPENLTAADQYVESVPTGEGSRPADRGPGGSAAAAPLPSDVKRKLPEGGELERVATSPALGAPTTKLRGGQDDTPSVPSATVRAVDGGGFELGWLLLALAAASVLLVAAALLRRHRRGEAGGPS
jgi:hypothetical protein